MFGAALLYGDGMITPAISVLSAVEGLDGRDAGLRAVRRADRGRHPGRAVRRPAAAAPAASATVFGPVMLVWFVVLAALGAARDPARTRGARGRQPRARGAASSSRNGWHGFLVLGSVFLVVTGGEALYADMGHFGSGPIRIDWFTIVLPALLLNYFGQGALLLREPAAAENPFYLLAPSWALYPLVALATAAAVIASQARHLRRVLVDRCRPCNLGSVRGCGSITPRGRSTGRSTFRRSTGR